MVVPDWAEIMISRMYGIDKSVLFINQDEISNFDLNSIKSIADIDPFKREITLANKLSGKNYKRVYATVMQEVKDSILEELKENDA